MQKETGAETEKLFTFIVQAVFCLHGFLNNMVYFAFWYILSFGHLVLNHSSTYTVVFQKSQKTAQAEDPLYYTRSLASVDFIAIIFTCAEFQKISERLGSCDFSKHSPVSKKLKYTYIISYFHFYRYFFWLLRSALVGF